MWDCSFFPQPGVERHPLQWMHEVLTTGLPGKSLRVNFYNLGFSNEFIEMTPKAHTIKENREIGLYQNIKFLCINGHDQESEMNLWNVVLWEIILFKNLKSIFHFEEWRYAKEKHTVSPTRREL